jgi:ParB-like chromosome segregation protein Spo0J
MPITSLKPHPHNARTHSKHQIRQIAQSIRRFGLTNPVLVDAKNQIIAGHGRVEAAKLLGLTEVPTIRLESLTEDQIASIECPFRHVRQGRAVRLVVGDTNITTDASHQAILKAIASARRWYEQITTGKSSNIAQLAGIDGVSPRFIRMQMKLVQLSPQSIENMMTRPESLPLSLDDLLALIPMDWRKQSLGLSAMSA